jgi:hypothetical protein
VLCVSNWDTTLLLSSGNLMFGRIGLQMPTHLRI